MTAISYDILEPSALDPDAPTASAPQADSSSTPPSAIASSSSATNTPSKPSGAARAGEGTGDGSDSDDDDAAPDYRLLGKLLGPQYASASSENNAGPSARHKAAPDGLLGGSPTAKAGSGQAIIPKRGEKDFEPTGFRGQWNALEDSRAAMFTAVSSGRRPPKSPSLATWDPILQRAIVHSSKGILFQSMGLTNRLPQHDEPPAKIDANGVHWPRIVSRIELTPEETLFLIERGVLDCRVRVHATEKQRAGEYGGWDEVNDELISGSGDGRREGGSDLRRAYALMMGADGCSKEVYGVYAYLRRLGYVVHRAKDVDAIRMRAAEKAKAEREMGSNEIDDDKDGEKDAIRAEGIIADRDRPLRLVTIWDILLYLPRRLLQLGGDAIRWTGSWARAAVVWLASLVGRVVSRLRVTTSFGRKPPSAGLGTARTRRPLGLLGIGGRTFADFDSAFSELQIVPSGHDLPLPSTTSTASPASTVVEKPTSSHQPSPPPFEIFFHAWRPATQFKKTYPPPPEFRIAICDARQQTRVPSMVQFAQMFGAVPMPGTEALDEEDAARAKEQVARNNASYGRAQSTKVRPARRGPPRPNDPEANEGVTGTGTGTGTGLIGLLQRAVRMARYVLVLLQYIPLQCYSTITGRPVSTHRRRYGPTTRTGGAASTVQRPNPFPPLKSGRRNVVVAVVDQGTTSLMRFGEAEFARWRLAGPPP
ncbi:hypothetical protein V8E36_009193 [Tilletia maclaganii]